MNNCNKFVKTEIMDQELAKITGNVYRVLSVNAYKGKDDVPEGVNVTALVLHDNAPEGYYGTKKDGTPREGIVYQNINFTLLTGDTRKTMQDLHAGDMISVFDIDQEHSYYIDFDLILRFKRYEKINNKAGKENPANDEKHQNNH